MSIKNTIMKIRTYVDKYATYTQEELVRLTEEMKAVLSNDPKRIDKYIPQAFAMVVVASANVLNMTHFDVQLQGGIVLHQGKIAEMKTGEGKTLVATCPVFLNALTGKGVHVITVNDYLAKRDCAQMGEVYKYLGLTCGCIYSGMPFLERKAAYQCDVTYGTNSEFGFDYLRDNLAKTLELTVQRGLNYAIIDEVDSVLIDDSKTPLIISGKTKNQSDLFEAVDAAVKSLNKTTNYFPDATMLEKLEQKEYNGDYIVVKKTKEVFLTDSGIKKIETILRTSLSDDTSLISHYVSQSLRANYSMEKDVDYVVKDGKIMIVDGSTGRIMESRKYSDSLHQAIEAKEGVQITEENVTQGTITYQNFFRMYKKISGMTGTAYTDRYEFKKIYGLKVERIPTNKPVIRHDAADVLYQTKEEKYAAILKKVEELHRKGQPILIGTPSVEESEKMAMILKKRIDNINVLNAKNHEKEAEIIAQAGTYGAVTIATNMAGRGTDILLGGNPAAELKRCKERLNNGDITKEEYQTMIDSIHALYKSEYRRVVEAGGLAVLGVERFDNRRIDDQLRGRSGRQGDPGYSQFFLSLEDRMLAVFGSFKARNIDFSYSTKFTDKLIRNAQKQIENIGFSMRKNALDYDDVNDSQRKQVYGMRNLVMTLPDEKLLSLFETYKTEVCSLLATADCDLKRIFKTDTEIEKSADKISAYIDSTIAQNEKNLITHGDNLPQMIRFIMLSTIDKAWIDYINQTISLKETVSITSMGTLKPIQLYKIQAIRLFNTLISDIKERIVIDTANIQIKPKEIKICIGINID